MMLSNARLKAFIAVPFEETYRTIYDSSIAPACRGVGLTPIRIDEQPWHSEIVRDIENEIRSSIVVVADISTRNPNVMFEVGFARALETPLVVLNSTDQDVPFDLRHRRYIKYEETATGLESLRRQLIRWLEAVRSESSALRPARVTCHGTKFDVPNRNAFWNDLLGQASSRFIVLGGSNKSWFAKSDQQAANLAEAILRIVRNKGTVRFIFDRRDTSLRLHLEFISRTLLPLTRSSTDAPVLESQLRDHLQLVANETSNYGAVVSDDRLVLLPTLNSRDFRDETLVLEIWGSSSPQFSNYLGDIDRLVRDRGERISWWNLLG